MPSSSATPLRSAWLAVETQFLGNRETRALHLDAAFRNFIQGDLSVTDYCKKFKQMAAELCELGEPVTDRTLVLNVLRGLNERYAALGMHLRRGRPFPSFLEVRNDLLLEELTAANRVTAPSTALVAATPAASRPPAPAPAPKSSSRSWGGSGESGGSSRSRRSKRDKSSGGSTGGTGGAGGGAPSNGGGDNKGAPASSTGSPAPLGSWPSLLNPWTGSIHMWPGQQGSALRPSPQPQQAMLAQQAQAQALQAQHAQLQAQALLQA